MKRKNMEELHLRKRIQKVLMSETIYLLERTVQKVKITCNLLISSHYHLPKPNIVSK